MNQYAPDYAKMKDFGMKVVNEGDGGVDYMFLREVGFRYISHLQENSNVNFY